VAKGCLDQWRAGLAGTLSQVFIPRLRAVLVAQPWSLLL
jgi:hypothetical protein